MARTESAKRKSPYTPDLGTAKQRLYREAFKRINRAIKLGSHIEAVALIESVMSDRIESAISTLTKREVFASSLGSLFRELDQLRPLPENLKLDVKEWNKSRGLVIHQMVKLTNDFESTWAERITFARHTALNGLEILKELRKFTDKIIRDNR